MSAPKMPDPTTTSDLIVPDGFIRLTLKSGATAYFSVSDIVVVADEERGPTITLRIMAKDGNPLEYYVRETPDEVAAAIARATQVSK